MAVYNLNLANEKQINAITDLETLRVRVPRFENFWDAVKDMKDLMANGGSTLGAHTKQSGFWPSRNMQRVATIPYSIAAAILEVDPEFFTDRGKVYRFLAQHPEYDTRTRVP